MEGLPKSLLRKLDHAEHLVNTDSILEFAADYPDAGIVAGMMNGRIDKKEEHTLFLHSSQRPSVELIKKRAKAQYSLELKEEDLPLDSTVLVVSQGNDVNLKALKAYIERRASGSPPRVMIWECPHSDLNLKEHAFLHHAARLWDLKPHIHGYENVYIQGDAPLRIEYIATFRQPQMSHYVVSAIALVVLIIVLYMVSQWGVDYFFKITAPSTKSLPNKPT